MSRRSADGLAGYVSLGGLLPAATVRRVVTDPRVMPSGGAEGYRLPPKAEVKDHIDRAWHDALAYYNDFTAAARTAGLLDDNDDPTSDAPGDPTLRKLSRDRFVLPLLHLLGWDDLEERPSGIDGDPDRKDADGNALRWDVTFEAVKRNVPVHVVGYDVPVDERSKGVAGASRQSPHSAVQDLLNSSDRHLWGIVVNGRRLRLLRDSSSLTRQAYAEFDLYAIFHDSAFAEFTGLWLLGHATRFERPDADSATTADLPIERLQREATDDGIRALDHLRSGVKDAIEVLGTGLLGHPRNQALRDALSGGELSDAEFYNQVLRTVYRWVFLFAVEDRELLHPPGSDPQAVATYVEHYATTRLREQARAHRGGRHGDGWQHYQLLVRCLRDGQPALAIPPVGGWLWSAAAAPDVDACALDNRALYEALRHLTTIEQDRALHRVSYKHLGAEELGSVYESLLELRPQSDSRRFRLEVLPGNERKKTGSYYTPTSLISRVLDDALDPVIERALAQAVEQMPAGVSPEARRQRLEATILGLTVCDPAMGSAHFLVAAAHRLAKRLAQVRTDDPEPDPKQVQRALRDVVSRCIYGVDVNPMAVELAKVALWLECHVPGTPLTFLDHHLRCGNALLGTGFDPSLMHWETRQRSGKKWGDGGVPDAALKALHGDDKAAAQRLRDLNRERRAGQASLFASAPRRDAAISELAAESARVAEIDDSTSEGLAAKQQAWEALVANHTARQERLKADAWTACWTMPKTKEQAGAHDQPFDVFYDAHYDEVPNPDRDGVVAIAREFAAYRFFHWHVEFPDVADAGGFSCLLGNPPWERMKLQQEEWFAANGRADIANAKNADARRRMIAALNDADDPVDKDLAARWDRAQHAAAATSNLVREGGRFPHGGVGDVNVYALFADHYLAAHNPDGAAGFICPTGLATGATYADFFTHLITHHRLRSFWSIWNHDRLFPAVNDRVTFALVTFVGTNHAPEEINFVGYVWQAEEIDDPTRRYTLSPADIAAINPNTGNAPLFRRARDAAIVAKIHRHAGALIDETVPKDDPRHDPWQVDFMSMFHMANDSGLFRDETWAVDRGGTLRGNLWDFPDGRRALPLYEGKLIWFYDHRAGTYEGQTEKQKSVNWIPATTDAQRADPSYAPKPGYWVEEHHVRGRLADRWNREWFIGWRDVTSATNERTLVVSVIPPVAVGHKLPLAMPEVSPTNAAVLLASMSSFIIDYRARQTADSGMPQFVVRQLPLGFAHDSLLPWAESLRAFVDPRVAELTYTARDLEAWARDTEFAGPPFRWEPSRRFLLQAELDAAFFHLYGLEREEVEWVMESFESLAGKERRSPERGGHGEFRTKRLILERYDAMFTAARDGTPYTTPLAPPPADDSLRHPA